MTVKHKSGMLLEVERLHGTIVIGYKLDNNKQRIRPPRGKYPATVQYEKVIVKTDNCTEVPITRQPRLFE